MTVTKNVYVLMLALVIVLSGCIGGTADGQGEGDCGESTDDCTTVIHNHYYNNTTTTTTTVIQETPEIIALGGWISDVAEGHTVATINTSAGELIEIISLDLYTTSGPTAFVEIQSNCTNNIYFKSQSVNDNQHTVSMIISGSAFDCAHSVVVYDTQGSVNNVLDVSWSMAYSIVPVTVG